MGSQVLPHPFVMRKLWEEMKVTAAILLWELNGNEPVFSAFSHPACESSRYWEPHW